MKKENDFHVTPDWLCDELIGLIPSDAKSICEPFAGNGAILNKIETKEDRLIYYYEIDEDRAIKLDTGKCILLDFGFGQFTYISQHFDCIVTNPPFTDIFHHIDNMTAALQEDGTLISVLPMSWWSKIHEFDCIDIIEKREKGTVDFNGTKVNVFILIAKKNSKYKGEEVYTEIDVTPKTKDGKYLLSQLMFFFGVYPKKVLKENFCTRILSEKDCDEWRVYLGKFKSPQFETWSEFDDGDAFSVFFKKDHKPTIDECLEEGFISLRQYFGTFDDIQQEPHSFAMEEGRAEEWIYLWYGKNEVPISEIRDMSYRLYKDSKLLSKFLFKNSKYSSSFSDLINETDENLNIF